MTMKIPRTALAASLTLLLAGCMVGPDYHRPSMGAPAPLQYKELPGWTGATPSDAAPKGDWWTDFHDPLLDQLEPMVATANQSVRVSYEQYQNALALVRNANSALFPTIGVTGSGQKARTSAGAGISSINNGSGISNINTSGSLEGNISWAPDFWGKTRRTIEESAATAQADQATLANEILTEQVALATAVVNLRTADANIDILQKTVEADRESLRVTQSQDKFGSAQPSDVVTAQTTLETAQASLINLGVARAQYEHAIAILVGKSPEELSIPHSKAMPELPSIPVGVPSTLLQRRPDIAIQERTMASANAAVGVAIAAYYPSITLSGSDGFSQSPLAGLLHIANHVWSLGANASETVFDFGARSSEVAAAKATYEAAVASYRFTVLSALQDVENDLSGLGILAQQAVVQDAAVRDAGRGVEIALSEYQAGTVDYTTVATAQATLLSNQQTALSVQQSRLLDAVSLIGDLGGGWSADQLADPRHPRKKPAQP